MRGTRLKLLVSTHTNWGTWKKKHPHTRVLSDQTGFQRSYDHKTQTAIIRNSKNEELPSVIGLWFAWYAFHPTTKVFIAAKKQ
jgi:hypothetical protein